PADVIVLEVGHARPEHQVDCVVDRQNVFVEIDDRDVATPACGGPVDGRLLLFGAHAGTSTSCETAAFSLQAGRVSGPSARSSSTIFVTSSANRAPAAALAQRSLTRPSSMPICRSMSWTSRTRRSAL